MKTLFSVLLIFAAAFAASCLNDDSGAEAQAVTITRAEFDALLARVELAEAAIVANRPGDKVFAAATVSGAFKAASAVGQPLGTMVGHLPANVALSRSTFFSLKSSTGYLYAVSNERNGNGVVGLATYAGDAGTGSRYVYFVANDCSGSPFVPGTEVSDYGASQGLVFMVGAGVSNEVIDNPLQYLYIAAGTERSNNVSYNSRLTRVGFCEASVGNLLSGYVALQNDEAVTGVESGPIASPVTLADPA